MLNLVGTMIVLVTLLACKTQKGHDDYSNQDSHGNVHTSSGVKGIPFPVITTTSLIYSLQESLRVKVPQCCPGTEVGIDEQGILALPGVDAQHHQHLFHFITTPAVADNGLSYDPLCFGEVLLPLGQERITLFLSIR
jgi:hypothetical protein